MSEQLRLQSEKASDAARSSKQPDLPSVPADTPTAMRRFLEPLREYVQTIAGRRGDDLDTAVTFRDLVTSGIAQIDVTKVSRTGAPPISLPLPDELVDFATPPPPTNLTVTSAVAGVIVQWGGTGFRNYDRTEIWRAETNNLSAAVRVGTSSTQQYYDNRGNASTSAFYWVRFVSKAEVVGPYNGTSGTGGAPTQDPAYLIDVLSETYGAAAVANAPFFYVASTTTINGVSVPQGTYIKAAFIADATITSAKIKDLAADKITAGYVSAAIGFNGSKMYGAELYSGGSVTTQTDANGNITGFTAVNPTFKVAGGVVDIKADAFRITNGGTGSIVPFFVTGETVYIDGAKVGNYIQSINYSAANKTGFYVSAVTGDAEFYNATLRGNLSGGSATDYSVGTGYYASSDGRFYVGSTGGVNAGTVYVFSRTGQGWTLQAGDASAGDLFGNAVAVSTDGTTVAVAAHQDSTAVGSAAGSVYIFGGPAANSWAQQAKLQPSDAAANDQFGTSIALSSDGNTLAVGANLEDPSSIVDAGAVYVFVRASGIWTQQAKIVASDAATNENFGVAVALSSDGNTLAVGANLEDRTSLADAGAVYVFTRSGTAWTQQAKVLPADAAASDQFGTSVALSSDGNTLAAGAPLDDNGSGTDAGAAYTFTRSGTTWTQQFKLTASDGAASDQLGQSVSLSSDGNTLAVGAPFDDHAGGTNAGSVYIYFRSGSTWVQQAKLTHTESAAQDRFGSSVSLTSDGNSLAVGAPGDDHSGLTDVGCIYTFVRSGTTWAQEYRTQAFGTLSTSDEFGGAVSFTGDGTALVVGAKNFDHYNGNRLGWDGTNLGVVGSGVFTGTIYASSGVFSGDLYAAGGTFTGALSAATGTFSGKLTAAAVDAVDTINLAGNAVTIPVGTSATDSASFGGGAGEVTVVSASLNPQGGNVIAIVSVAISPPSDDVVVFTLKRGTTILIAANVSAQGVYTLSFRDATGGTSSLTYSATLQHSSFFSAAYGQRSIALIGAKR